jgi:enoyl-CoA hydratase
MSWSLEIRDSVAYVSFARPPENRLPFSALRDLDSLLETVRDESSAKLVVFMSGVDGVFSAGADLDDIRAVSTGARPSADFDWWMRALMRVEELPQPTVAFVDGLAASGGAELALACTMRVGTDRTEFVFREVTRGAIPGAGATQRLPRLVGIARSAEIIMSGRSVGVEEACRLGLIQGRLQGEPTRERLQEWLGRFAAASRSSLIAAKRALVEGARLPLYEGLRLEQGLFRNLVSRK